MRKKYLYIAYLYLRFLFNILLWRETLFGVISQSFNKHYLKNHFLILCGKLYRKKLKTRFQKLSILKVFLNRNCYFLWFNKFKGIKNITYFLKKLDKQTWNCRAFICIIKNNLSVSIFQNTQKYYSIGLVKKLELTKESVNCMHFYLCPTM